jgi:hypothetical protein
MNGAAGGRTRTALVTGGTGGMGRVIGPAGRWVNGQVVHANGGLA